MPQTNFSKSWGGKLIPDYFGTGRLRDDDKYYLGAVHDIILDGVNIGTAKIVAAKTFRLDGVRDVFSFLDANMNAAKFCGMMQTMYKNHLKDGVKPSTEFVHVVYQWQYRNYPVQVDMISAFMERKLQEYREALQN